MRDKMGERIKMKPANAITAAILISVLAAGWASAQNPGIIQNTRNTMNAVSSHDTAASNEALGINQSAPAVVTPAKSSSSSSGASAAGPKHPGHGKHVPGSAVRHTAAVVVAPASHPTAGVSVAGSGAAESTEKAVGTEANDQEVVPDAKYAANGRRDPFISPVVSHAGGSGCSTGKKCLEIGAINLRGVVHAESGFIAVVSNGLNKAYFLRENDPVFNGYVVKITGDSIVFQETLQDRLGKTFTREVVKKITTPAV
jgi:hypothetical protein